MAKEFADIHSLIGQVAKDYQYKEAPSLPDWLTSLWNRAWQFVWDTIVYWYHKLVHLLSKLAIGLKGNGGTEKVLFIIIFLAVLLSAAIALIIWQQRRWLMNRWSGKPGIAGSGISDRPQTSLEWRQQAATLEKEGRFHEACRSLHRACLQMFDEANLITFVPARSNYEYAIAIARQPTLTILPLRQNLRQKFQSFSNAVDAIYFGNRPAGEKEFQFCLQSLQEIEGYLVGIVPAEKPS